MQRKELKTVAEWINVVNYATGFICSVLCSEIWKSVA